MYMLYMDVCMHIYVYMDGCVFYVWACNMCNMGTCEYVYISGQPMGLKVNHLPSRASKSGVWVRATLNLVSDFFVKGKPSQSIARCHAFGQFSKSTILISVVLRTWFHNGSSKTHITNKVQIW